MNLTSYFQQLVLCMLFIFRNLGRSEKVLGRYNMTQL